MKKTLIALAVAASAAVSGSAMAWTQQEGAFNGQVDISGVLTPETVKLPWEIQIGSGYDGFSGTITKGATQATLNVAEAIPVLGMRTVAGGFTGAEGLTPKIDYQGAVNVSGFSAGVTTLTLDIADTDGNNIGTMTVPFSSAAFATNGTTRSSLYAEAGSDYGFVGGLGTSSSAVVSSVASSEYLMKTFFPSILETRGDMSKIENIGAVQYKFNSRVNYRAAYASGIPSGNTLKITLNQAAGDEDIQWKASLPVTVSYQ